MLDFVGCSGIILVYHNGKVRVRAAAQAAMLCDLTIRQHASVKARHVDHRDHFQGGKKHEIFYL